MTYIKFNFKEALKHHNPQKVKWFKDNWDKKITEKQFIEAMESLKQFSKAKHINRDYRPQQYRKHYKRLKLRYGFFC